MDCVRAACQIVSTRDTEIDQAQAPVLPQHYIRRLEIAEDDRAGLPGMQIVQNIAQLPQPVDCQIFRDRTIPGEIFPQVFAADIVLDNGDLFIVFKYIDDMGQHRMRELL